MSPVHEYNCVQYPILILISNYLLNYSENSINVLENSNY